jgi:hypothetical protein
LGSGNIPLSPIRLVPIIAALCCNACFFHATTLACPLDAAAHDTWLSAASSCAEQTAVHNGLREIPVLAPELVPELKREFADRNGVSLGLWVQSQPPEVQYVLEDLNHGSPTDRVMAIRMDLESRLRSDLSCEPRVSIRRKARILGP